MTKYMKKKNRKKGMCFAAAAITVALLAGQVPPSARNVSAAVEMNMVIPDNVTIDAPTELANVQLPKSEYGRLRWVDDSFVPLQRVQSCEVVFIPDEGIAVEGADPESGKIYTTVTVVVLSLEEEETEEGCDSDNHEYDSANDEMTDEQEDASEESSADETPSGELPDLEEGSEEDEKNSTEEADTDVTEDDQIVNEEKNEEASSGETSEDEPEQNRGESEETKKTEESEEELKDGAEDTQGKDEANEPGDEADNSEDRSENENTEESTEENTEENTEKDTEKNTEDNNEEDNSAEDSSAEDNSTEEDNTEENNEDNTEEKDAEEEETEDHNIFDRTPDQDEPAMRVINLSDDLTEEEQQAQAAINHSCNGITVSGIDLPWYVQFRASVGADYEFSNEESAEIFKSYEFELWDLKHQVPYEIPDGEYISVTVPVKAGYDYTVEHILGSGATETIVPSVNGSTLVFSTHSFSPFSIAGSQSLVGEDVAKKGYATPTPTPVSTKTPATVSGNSGTSASGNTSSSGNRNSGQNTSYEEDNSYDEPEASADDRQEDNSGHVRTAAVRTGDDTQILPLVILAAAALLIVIFVLLFRKKKK